MVYVTACDKVKSLVVHWDSSNKATQTQLQPVLPQGMVNLRPAEFLHKVCDQHDFLDHPFLLPKHINILGDQNKELLTAYSVEPTTQTLIKSCNGTTSFAEA